MCYIKVMSGEPYQAYCDVSRKKFRSDVLYQENPTKFLVLYKGNRIKLRQLYQVYSVCIVGTLSNLLRHIKGTVSSLLCPCILLVF